MPLQYRIFHADGTGVSGAGGPPSVNQASLLVPPGLVSPYQGQGDKYVYRKYFLQITEFSDVTGLPVISSVDVVNETTTTADIVFNLNEPCITEIGYGTTPNGYGSNTIYVGGISYVSGDQTGNLTSLEEDTLYYFRISATDQDDNYTQYLGTFNTTDGTAPVFGSVGLTDITDTSATVVWTTDEPSTSKVRYGTSAALGSDSDYDTTLVTSHRRFLTSLTPFTQYFYTPVSVDAAGNSGQYTINRFVTLEEGEGNPALTITSVNDASATTTGATITWFTNNPADTNIKYSTVRLHITGSGVYDGVLSYNDTTLETGHTGIITNCTPGRDYYYKVQSTDVYGQTLEDPVGASAYTFSTAEDTIISVIHSGNIPSETSAIVGFTTDESATGWVRWSLTDTFVSGQTGAAATTQHYMTIPGLTSNITYYYIMGADMGTHTGAITGPPYNNFTTLDVTPPVMSSFVTGGNDSTLSFSWTTNERATTEASIVRVSDGFETQINSLSLGFNHNVSFNGLPSSTAYTYDVGGSDRFDNHSNETGTINTLAPPVGPDTQPPLITNVSVSTTDTLASVSWSTDEPATSAVEYSVGAFPGTVEALPTAYVQSHSVSIDSLSSETTYNFRVISADDDGNIATGNINQFTTDAASSGSSFAPGDTVAWIEWEVPPTVETMTSALIPVRAIVPVQGSGDLQLPWYTSLGRYCQREVVKRDGSGEPVTVEIVFPVQLSHIQETGANNKTIIQIVAQSEPTSISWNTFAIPSDLKVTLTLPDGQISTATLDPNQTPAANKKNVRGDLTSALPGETFPYCRTVKIYNRCTLQGSITEWTGPDASTLGVHAYITYWNKDLFTDFYPQLDIRISNAHVNTAAPAVRGGLYYKNISIAYPTQQPDNVELQLVMDMDIKTTAKRSTTLALVLPHVDCTPDPLPMGDTTHYLGGNSTQYTALYTNDLSNHYFYSGSQLDFRVALHQKSNANNQSQQRYLAGLYHIGYCILYEASPSTMLTARSWSTCRSYGPMNTYLPTYGDEVTWNGYTGREAKDQRAKASYLITELNLKSGKYIYSALNGPAPGAVNSTTAYPVQFGPYRPYGGFQAGDEGGGSFIDHFFCHNHSKWEVLQFLYLNRMQKARHFYTQYTSTGEPTTVWDLRIAGGDTDLGPPGQAGYVNLGWRNGPEIFLDSRGTNLFNYWIFSGGNQYMIAPSNSPTVAVTPAHSYAVGSGCSYHDDRTSYGTNPEGGTFATTVGPNGRYHLYAYNAFDHQHQVRINGPLIGIVELTNDILLKDDLLMQAHIDTLSMSQYSNSNADNVTGYNLAELYYGVDRGGNYVVNGVTSAPNNGLPFGRTFGWPLLCIVAAYQFANSTNREILLENLKFWGKMCKEAILPIGSLTRDGVGKVAIVDQHYGLFMKGITAYLRTDSSNWQGYGVNGYNLASTYNSESAQYIDTTLTSNIAPVLVGEWAITQNGSADSVYDLSYTYSNSLGLILRVNSFLATWKANFSAQRIAGSSGGGRYTFRIFLRNDSNGAIYEITNGASGENLTPVGATKTSITCTPTQIYPIAIGGDNTVRSFGIPYSSGFHRLIFRVYCSSFGLSGADTCTMRTYMGSSDPFVVTTSLEHRYGAIYDHAQIFETHIFNSAMLALSRNVLAHQPDDTASTTLLTSIRNFYHNFYSIAPVDFTQPGAVNHSSTWVKYAGGYSESWVIGVAYNNNYPPGGNTSPLPAIVVQEGRYSNEPTDWYQYAPWSSYIGMMAEEELGTEFTLTLSDTPFTPGYLLDKWCKMGTSHSSATAHRDYIGSLFVGTNNYTWTPSYAAGTIAHINYKLMQGGLLATSSTEVAPNVRVFLLDESSPGRIQIAATPYREDRMTDASVVAGSQESAAWADGETEVERPDFRFARGAGNAVLLYNNEGELGGDVNVSTDLADAIPFWVRYRLDENQSSNDGYLRFGVLAGEGAVGGGNSNQADPDPVQPGDQVLWSDPSGDMVVQFGTERVVTNSITKTSNTYYFNSVGSDETLQYVVSFDTNSGNANGLLRIYETNSASWPVYNGGLSYRNNGGLTYNPTGLSGVTTLKLGYPRKSTDGTQVVAEYINNLDGGKSSRYTFSMTGKCLRIKMEATDINTNYSGSFYNASIGIASGIENPRYIEIAGAGNVPIVMFNGPSTDKYFWGGHIDPTQSNGHYTYQTYNPTGALSNVMSGTNWFTNPLYTNYVAMDDGKQNASLSETFGIGISKTSKDLYVKSTSPTSPYRADSEGDYVMLLANDVSDSSTAWTTGSYSYLDVFKLMTGCYMEDMAIWAFSWWSDNFDSHILGASPWYAPAVDSTNFAVLSQFARNQDWKFGGYLMYTVIESGNPWFDPEYLCGKATGWYETVVTTNTRGTTITGYALSYDRGIEIVESDTASIASAYNWNLALYDVETYSMLGAMVNRFDKRSTAAIKTNRDFIINQKLNFDTIRRAFDGPLYGEGALSYYEHDAQWLWGGWVDSTYRNICTNSFPFASSVTALPSGHVRCPTRWWNVVDFEWHSLVPQQINQGLSFDDRLWTASDYDVAYTRTGAWQLSDMWPYTTGAWDRIRAYRLMWGRAPYLGTNGYIDGPGNYHTFEGLIVDYYLTKGVNDRCFSSPVQSIKYLTGSLWSGFDDIMKTSSRLETFCRIPVNIELQNGFNMYINPSTGNVEVNLSNGDQYILPQDGFLAYSQDDTFVAFTAAPTNTSYGASDSVISYVNDPGKYEAFYGRNLEERFGNISTAGNNLKQFKVWNYTHTGTVQTETGVGYTYPQIFTYQGLI